jgi:alcohol dehydrogenase YqhD (iron-dependent ADH family)
MKDFVFQNATRIYFGRSRLDSLAVELSNYGKRVLVTYGGGSIKKIGLYDRIMEILKENGFTVFEMGGIEPNPRHTSVNRGARICKDEKIDVVLAVGGGSVIDASKFICSGALYDGDIWDLVKRKAPITGALPLVSVLTLAATGSEMDSGGVITNLETNEKIGGGHPSMFPKASFLDPTLTYTVSAYQTACGSADILSHTMETYFAREDGMYFLDTVMEGIMKTVIKYAPIAIREPDNYEARANLMWASSWAINGFVRADKPYPWSCHPMEHELSAFYDITHGLGLAILTPRWMRHVKNPDNISRFVKFGVNVFGIDPSLPDERIAELSIEKLEEFLFRTMGLTDNLTELGITDEHFETMAERVAGARPLAGFVDLKKEDVLAILKACL